METTAPRPRPVTFAGWVIIAASVGVVVGVWDRVSRLHTLDSQEALARMLREPGLSGLGLSVDELQAVLHVVAMVAAACATACAILGWHAMQRSRTARVVLTALAVPLFLTGASAGGFLPSVVAGAVVLLWMQPARDWFAGRTPAPAPAARALWPPSPPSATAGRDGSAQPQQPGATTPGATTPGATTPAGSSAAFGGAVAARPPAVLAAAVITWITGGLVALALVVQTVAFALDPSPTIERMRHDYPEMMAQPGMSEGLLVGSVVVLMAGLVLWALAACGLAFLVLRRRSWARVLLAVSAGVAAACMLAMTIMSVAMAVPLMLCALTLSLLLRREVVQWFQAPAPTGPTGAAGPPYPPLSGPGGPQQPGDAPPR